MPSALPAREGRTPSSGALQAQIAAVLQRLSEQSTRIALLSKQVTRLEKRLAKLESADPAGKA